MNMKESSIEENKYEEELFHALSNVTIPYLEYLLHNSQNSLFGLSTLIANKHSYDARLSYLDAFPSSWGSLRVCISDLEHEVVILLTVINQLKPIL